MANSFPDLTIISHRVLQDYYLFADMVDRYRADVLLGRNPTAPVWDTRDGMDINVLETLVFLYNNQHMLPNYIRILNRGPVVAPTPPPPRRASIMSSFNITPPAA